MLSFPPLISIARSSLAIAMPLPITSLDVAHAHHRCLIDRHCFYRSLLLSFSLFDGFGILISGFWWSVAPLLYWVSPLPCHRRSLYSLLLTLIAAALPIAATLWLPLLSVFFVWWFWDFDLWILKVLINGFDDFDPWVLINCFDNFD